MGGQTYRIASFNMRKLNYQSSGDTKKNFGIIANIIYREKFDIVAMQEVPSKSAVNYLLSNPLLRDWDSRWDQPRFVSEKKVQEMTDANARIKGYSNSQTEAEGYAFIWNTKRFSLAKKRDGITVRDPQIWNQYKSYGFGGLARNPYFGCFAPVGREGVVELRLINTHITFGNSATQRKKEFLMLAEIYKRIESDSEYSPAISSKTILLGDYNLSLPKTSTRQHTRYPFLTSPETGLSLEVYEMRENLFASGDSKIVRTLITVQEDLSTLRQVDPGMSQNYDHFTFNKKYLDNQQCKNASAVDSVNKYCGGDYEVHRKQVSDHVPVKMDVKY